MQISAPPPLGPVSSYISSFSAIGFSGSRFRPSPAVSSAYHFLCHVRHYTGQVGVGCARGVDTVFRSFFQQAHVFRVQPPVTRASFAQRSARLVHWVQSNHGLLIAFPLSAAPQQLVPSSTFSGHGCGTWGTVALALGLQVPVLLVIPSFHSGILSAPAPVSSRFSYAGYATCGGSLWLSQ